MSDRTGRASARPDRRGYDRERDLPKLLALWPAEVTDRSEAGRLLLLSKLRRALRAERQRGLAGHWTYDLARHRGLLLAYRAETAAALTGTRKAKGQQTPR